MLLVASGNVVDGYVGFIFVSSTSSGRKVSKIIALWGKVSLWYNSMREAWEKWLRESLCGINSIWLMVSSVIEIEIFPFWATTVLLRGPYLS